jgi:hypothetical protein
MTGTLVQLPAWVRDISLKASRGAVGTHVGVVYQGCKGAGACGSSFFSTSAEVKNEWSFTSANSACLRGVYRQNVNF